MGNELAPLDGELSDGEEKIGLVTDDVCSLPEKIINGYQVEIVRVKLFFPEWENSNTKAEISARSVPQQNEFYETESSGKNLYQVMKETKAFPKTSAPSPGDFLKIYKKILENFEKILVITLSSKLSATFNSAFQAKEMMSDPSKIFLFDSLTAAAAQGLLTIKAAELIREGRKIEEIVKILEIFREKVKILAFLNTTYWLEKIGRMSHRQATAFKIIKGLGIQPMIGTKNGKVNLTGFNFWTKDTLKATFHQLRNIAKKSKIKVVINYTDNIDLAHKLKERIEKELKTEVLFVSLVPSIIGANTGPGTLLVGTIPV